MYRNHSAGRRKNGGRMLTTQSGILSRAEFDWFRKLIEKNTGLHILDYKVTFLTNRLLKRMRVLGIDTFEDYHNMLEQEGPQGEELKVLLEEIVVFESWFFRNTKQFTILSDVILPALVNEKIDNDKRVIINILGCSAGQEPYSIAILLHEMMPPHKRRLFRINAVDISMKLLRKAKNGFYKEYEINGLPDKLLWKHFERVEGGYQISEEISRMVNFFQFNLKDSNWNKFRFSDAIFCRNTLIYFREESRKQIMDRLIDSIRPGGFILLGHSEILNEDDYRNISSIAHNIYRKVKA
ncbi:MAG: hypothetical protein GF417_12085 [Candidatus Latescibacteria bacterium]|nr:hypothetical protein [bacterium]MBD3425166.1 hypothetical protein [Candidatus Latescibacterota bacterium]